MYFRIVKLSESWYAKKLEDITEDDLYEIKEFIESGESVVLTSCIGDFCEEYDIDVNDVILVEDEDYE